MDKTLDPSLGKSDISHLPLTKQNDKVKTYRSWVLIMLVVDLAYQIAVGTQFYPIQNSGCSKCLYQQNDQTKVRWEIEYQDIQTRQLMDTFQKFSTVGGEIVENIELRSQIYRILNTEIGQKLSSNTVDPQQPLSELIEQLNWHFFVKLAWTILLIIFAYSTKKAKKTIIKLAQSSQTERITEKLPTSIENERKLPAQLQNQLSFSHQAMQRAATSPKPQVQRRLLTNKVITVEKLDHESSQSSSNNEPQSSHLQIPITQQTRSSYRRANLAPQISFEPLNPTPSPRNVNEQKLNPQRNLSLPNPYQMNKNTPQFQVNRRKERKMSIQGTRGDITPPNNLGISPLQQDMLQVVSENSSLRSSIMLSVKPLDSINSQKRWNSLIRQQEKVAVETFHPIANQNRHNQPFKDLVGSRETEFFIVKQMISKTSREYVDKKQETNQNQVLPSNSLMQENSSSADKHFANQNSNYNQFQLPVSPGPRNIKNHFPTGGIQSTANNQILSGFLSSQQTFNTQNVGMSRNQFFNGAFQTNLFNLQSSGAVDGMGNTTSGANLHQFNKGAFSIAQGSTLMLPAQHQNYAYKRQYSNQMSKTVNQLSSAVGSVTANPVPGNSSIGRLSAQVQSLMNQIKKLEKQVTNTKIFLNMVIHDMRNPTNSIEYALKEVIQLIQDAHNRHYNELTKLKTSQGASNILSPDLNQHRTLLDESPQDILQLSPQLALLRLSDSSKKYSKPVMDMSHQPASYVASLVQGIQSQLPHLPEVEESNEESSEIMSGAVGTMSRQIQVENLKQPNPLKRSSIEKSQKDPAHHEITIVNQNMHVNKSVNLLRPDQQQQSENIRNDLSFREEEKSNLAFRRNNESSVLASREIQNDERDTEEPERLIPQSITKVNCLEQITEHVEQNYDLERQSPLVLMRERPKFRRFIQLTDIIDNSCLLMNRNTEQVCNQRDQDVEENSINIQAQTYLNKFYASNKNIQGNILQGMIMNPGNAQMIQNKLISSSGQNIVSYLDPQAALDAFVANHERIPNSQSLIPDKYRDVQDGDVDDEDLEEVKVGPLNFIRSSTPPKSHIGLLDGQNGTQLSQREELKINPPTRLDRSNHGLILIHNMDQSCDNRGSQSVNRHETIGAQHCQYGKKKSNKIQRYSSINSKLLQRRKSTKGNIGLGEQLVNEETLIIQGNQMLPPSPIQNIKRERKNSSSKGIGSLRMKPLLNIIQQASVILNNEDKKLCDQWLKNSLFSSTMLLNLINDLLDLAKIENSQFNFNTTQFNLHDVIQKALETLSYSAQQKSIQMRYSFDDEDAGYLMEISGDDYRYLQILLNFLSNALKFTNQNGTVIVQTKILDTQQINQPLNPDSQLKSNANLESKGPNQSSLVENLKRSQSFNEFDQHMGRKVEDLPPMASAEVDDSSNKPKLKGIRKTGIVGGEDKPAKVSRKGALKSSNRPTRVTEKYIKFEIRVIDSGLGISKENLDKLFMNFGKLDEHAAGNKTGTGLGLSICKNLIEMMGGSVTVESEVGVGTQFIMQLQTKCKLMNQKRVFKWLKDFKQKLNPSIVQEDYVKYDYQQQPFNVFQALNMPPLDIELAQQSVGFGQQDFFNNLDKLILNSSKNSMIDTVQDNDQLSPSPSKYEQNQLQVKTTKHVGGFGGSLVGMRRGSANLKGNKALQRSLGGAQQTLPSKFKKVIKKKVSEQRVDSKGFSSHQSDEQPQSEDGKQLQLSGSSSQKVKRQNDVDQNSMENKSLTSEEERPKYRALIANDDMFQLRIVCNLMQSCGFETVEAENGLVAVQLYQQASVQGKHFDVIILDLDMPIINGFEACKRIRKSDDRENLMQLIQIDTKNREEYGSYIYDPHQFQQSQEIIVALSGLITDSIIEKGQQCGFDLFIETPLTIVKIKTNIIMRLEHFEQDRIENIMTANSELYQDHAQIVGPSPPNMIGGQAYAFQNLHQTYSGDQANDDFQQCAKQYQAQRMMEQLPNGDDSPFDGPQTYGLMHSSSPYFKKSSGGVKDQFPSPQSNKEESFFPLTRREDGETLNYLGNEVSHQLSSESSDASHQSPVNMHQQLYRQQLLRNQIIMINQQ